MRLPCSESAGVDRDVAHGALAASAHEVDRAEIAARPPRSRRRRARSCPARTARRRGWSGCRRRRGSTCPESRSTPCASGRGPGTVRIVVAQPKDLDLNDGPARASKLFLIDGNSLGYRAFYALPEELATSDGFPTNALLGFTNMLMRLLGDYRPRGRAGRLGRAPDAPARAVPRLQVDAQADARPAAPAAALLPAAGGGVRLPQRLARGARGRRRDRHPRDARRGCRASRRA